MFARMRHFEPIFGSSLPFFLRRQPPFPSGSTQARPSALASGNGLRRRAALQAEDGDQGLVHRAQFLGVQALRRNTQAVCALD